MGLLPTERLRPTPPFTVTGIDYAGPLMCKRGNPRKPTIVKTYACLFVCFSTKAIHIELVSDLTSDAFLAALTRFTGRRGCPTTLFSDNGTNFVGANRQLQDLQKLLTSKTTQDQILNFTNAHRIEWRFSPSRSPHFGGLWESNIKNMKTLLRKTIGTHNLTFEELSTVLVEVEATLNSRPLHPLDSTSPDGLSPLTPGHFIIGRPLRAPPSKVDLSSKMSNLRRWNLTKRLSADDGIPSICKVFSGETSGNHEDLICNQVTLYC